MCKMLMPTLRTIGLRATGLWVTGLWATGLWVTGLWATGLWATGLWAIALRALGLWAIGLSLQAVGATAAAQQEAPASDATEACLACHEITHPGLVAGWQASRHARVTPEAALEAEPLARRVSSQSVPAELRGTTVGCAECHTLRSDRHADSFEHNGYTVHLVVSPDDCATCHATETEQYAANIMAHAHANLVENGLYQDLERHILGRLTWSERELGFAAPATSTREQACLHCHGTRLAVTGTVARDTELGEMSFPAISGWPNQGVGRVNLDGSLGSCSACHTRHGFAIEVARQPYTCEQCHVGPDVPVYKVYSASKHGNIFSSRKSQWELAAVPWKPGADFEAPTCAACHVSLLVEPGGNVVAERTHRMNDRLPWRIFGLIYSHAHPKDPRTHVIRNQDGLPLPTALDGTPASDYLIGPEEQAARRKRMEAICLSCHGGSWVQEHFRRYDESHRETNAATLACTTILLEAWEQGFAAGPAAGSSPFDEAVEQVWMDAWLFHANSIRFASAMAGGGDYAVFANGQYELAGAAKRLRDWLAQRARAGQPTSR